MVLNTTDFARRSCTSTLVPEWPFGGLAFCICSSSGSVAATTQPMHHVAAPLSYGHTPTDLRAPPACTHIAGGTAAAARLPQGAADAVGVAGLQPELHVHAARAPAHGSRASGGAHAGRRRRAPAVCRPGCATQAAGAARAAAPATIRPGTRYAVHQSGAPVRGLAPRDLYQRTPTSLWAVRMGRYPSSAHPAAPAHWPMADARATPPLRPRCPKLAAADALRHPASAEGGRRGTQGGAPD